MCNIKSKNLFISRNNPETVTEEYWVLPSDGPSEGRQVFQISLSSKYKTSRQEGVLNTSQCILLSEV